MRNISKPYYILLKATLYRCVLPFYKRNIKLTQYCPSLYGYTMTMTSLFNTALSIEPNFSRIHHVGQYRGRWYFLRYLQYTVDCRILRLEFTAHGIFGVLSDFRRRTLTAWGTGGFFKKISAPLSLMTTIRISAGSISLDNNFKIGPKENLPAFLIFLQTQDPQLFYWGWLP